MKKKLLLLLFLATRIFSNAQNVGIGTTTPQSTLDVKGNIRTGGINNFISYDSLAGKITWTNSNLWVTGPQYLMKHSASAEGLYSNGAQLEYRNSTGNPVYFTNWSNGNGYFSGNLGIGTVSPTAKLQIRDGASGITPFFSARMVVETNNHTYINLLSPDPFETGILFGSGTNAVSGLISYNSATVPKGFIFNNNGNQTRMVIDNTGNVGIGTTTPGSKLEITHNGSSTFGTALLINQNLVGNSDGPKIQFQKAMTASKSWTAGILNGVNVGTFAINEDGGTGGFGTPRLTIIPGGNIGIGTTTPQYPLDINGRMRLSGTNLNDPGMWLNDAGADRAFIGLQNNDHVGFYGYGGINWGFTMNTITGALAVNGTEGTAGQVLQSNGSSAAATWVSPVNNSYNNTNMFRIASSFVTTEGPPAILIPGLDYTFTVSGNAKILVSFSLLLDGLGCGTCESSGVFVDLYLNSAAKARFIGNVPSSLFLNLTGNYLLSVGPGTHHVQLFETTYGPPVYFDSGNTISTNMIVQILSQ